MVIFFHRNVYNTWDYAEIMTEERIGNLLILGSSGMLGTAIEEVCKESGIRHLGLSHHDLDISDKDELEKKVDESKPSIIINSAAMMGIPPCEENPVKAFEINAVSPLNLARICRDRNIALVHIGSNAIFDGKKGDLYFEEDFPNPQNIYGLSKYAGELCVQNNLPEHYIMRVPKLFGSRRNSTPGFTDKIMERMKLGKELKIADDRIDTFTYTVHAARKMISLVQNSAPFGVYHVANRGSVSYYDFICKFAEKIGYRGEIKRAKDSDFSAPAPNPLRTELGSSKIHDMPTWNEALDEYFDREKIRL